MAFIFDHIVIAANSLSQGVEYIEQKLGVRIPFGGEHDQMGTHNHLMQIGEGIFLELIAINPDAAPPKAQQKRWFGLDNSALQAQLKQQPKLLTWVASTTQLTSQVKHLPIDIGQINNVSRGALTWQITIPKDGSLIEQGLFPTLIQWQNNQTPAPNMQDLGLRLTELTLTHPDPERFGESLKPYVASTQFELKIQKGDYGMTAKLRNKAGKTISL